MSLTVNANQLTLAQHGSVGVFPLVVLETFSDRDARTVASTYYWTRGAPFSYKWDGVTAVQFDPALLSVSPISRGFEHMPDQGNYTIREGLELELDATPRAGNYLWKDLLADQLIGARVTVGSILINMDSAETDPRWFDLEALGSQHVIRWRGEVTAVPLFSDDTLTFSLVCDTEDQILVGGRIVPVNGRIPPEQHGLPYPFLVGEVDAVSPIWWDAGFSLTTSESFSALLDATIEVFATQPPLASSPVADSQFDILQRFGSSQLDGDVVNGSHLNGYCLIGGSEIGRITSAQVISAGIIELTISRGEWGTTAISGNIGTEIICFGRELLFAVSGQPISGLGDKVVYQTGAGGNIDILQKWPAAVRAVNIHGLSYADASDPTRTQPKYFVETEQVVGALQINLDALQTNNYVEAETLDLVKVDVKGGYEQGSSSSALFSLSADGPNWEGKYAGEDRDLPAAGWGAANSGSSLRLTQAFSPSPSYSSFWETRFHRPGLSFAAGLGEIEVQFDISSAIYSDSWDAFCSIAFYINSDAVVAPGYHSYAYANGRTFQRGEIQEGSNTVRFLCNVATITDFGVIVRHISVNPIASTPYSARQVVITADPVFQSGSEIGGATPGSHPADVLEYVLDNLVPSAAITKNAASFAQNKTDVPNVSVNTNISAIAETLAELVAAVGFNSRTNAVLFESPTGTELKLHSANASYNFGAVIRAIGSDFTDLKMSVRDILEQGNQFSAVFDSTTGEDLSLTKNYGQSLTVNEMTNDLSTITHGQLTASQSELGVRRTLPLPLAMITDATSAEDVVGYYATESLRGQVARYTCLVPYSVGYDLEAGDIVSIQPRWEAAPVKVRLLQIVFNFDENAVGLVLEQVT